VIVLPDSPAALENLLLPLSLRTALSILEKLQVPEGWCSSGLRAKEYT
jgi:hypothetical protein